MRADQSPSAAEPERGFTLLEVIIALMIAGFALAAMFAFLETGLAGGSRADHSLRAISIARSELSAAIATPVLRPGTQEYVIERYYHSTVDIRQVATGSATRGSSERPGLFSVSVTVTRDGSARAVNLTGRAVRIAVTQE